MENNNQLDQEERKEIESMLDEMRKRQEIHDAEENISDCYGMNSGITRRRLMNH